MSESALLFLILGAIYLSECFFWVRRDAMAFLAGAGETWLPAHAGTAVGNQHGGLLVSNPLPFFGASLVCQSPPLSISPEGIYAYSAQALDPAGRPPQTGRFCRFEEIRTVTVSTREVRINGARFTHAASAAGARELAALLDTLASSAPAAREREIRAAVRRSFDRRRVSERVGEHRRRTRVLQIICTAQFALLFGVAPALVWRYGLISTWVPLLAGVGVLHAAAVVAYGRAHRALYPEARSDRRANLAVLALSPPAAIRARDLLARELLPISHPVAVAAELCSRDSFLNLAARALNDARYPLPPVCPAGEAAPGGVEEWWRSRQQEALERFAADADVDVAALTAPPLRHDAAVVSFCPRCRAQYLRIDAGCPDCGGMAVLPLPPAPAAGPAAPAPASV